MSDGSYCWACYRDAMRRACRTPDPLLCASLMLEAFNWLDSYFEAEEQEFPRREHAWERW